MKIIWFSVKCNTLTIPKILSLAKNMHSTMTFEDNPSKMLKTTVKGKLISTILPYSNSSKRCISKQQVL